MNVITESEIGDRILIIQEFNASPYKEPFSWKTCRQFNVGESVRFSGYYQEQHFKGHPGLGWMIIFEASDGKRYGAKHTFFVTKECWTGLRRYFSKALLSKPRIRNASRKTT
jgi:hypothetical protein